MKRLAIVPVLIFALTLQGCGFMSLFGGDGAAKAHAVEILTMQTESAFLAMTALGLAYNNGAFGEPGGVAAESTWSRIAVESTSLNMALTEWTKAINEGTDPAFHKAMVKQSMARLKALIPSKSSTLGEPYISPTMTMANATRWLGEPERFRSWSPQFAGGSR